MQYGLVIPSAVDGVAPGASELRDVVAFAEREALDALWVADHLLWRTPVLDPMVALAALSMLTTRVCLGTAVLQLPLRRPLGVAKGIASISHLSRGRVVLGIGVGGDFRPEWDAAGVDPSERGKRCDEAIDTLRLLWRGFEGRGRYFDSPGLPILPPPHELVPIWIGGRGAAAVRRAARCDGALPLWVSPERVSRMRAEIADLRYSMAGFTFGIQLFVRVGRSVELARAEALRSLGNELGADASFLTRYLYLAVGSPAYLAVGSPAHVIESVQAYIAAGAEHVSFYLVGTDWWDQAHALADDVLPGLRASVSLARG